MEQGFRGNCDFKGKLGMCPSLAEPDWGGFPKRIVFSYKPQANKSFSVQQFFKNAAEVWASSPHLRSKSKLHNQMQWYPKGIAFFQTMQKTPCNTIKNRL